MSTTNQPSTKRRDKLSLGHSHLQVPGKISAQSMDVQEVLLNYLGKRADVTQATNINTAVTANGRFGAITTQGATTAADGTDAFAFNNTFIDANSVILLTVEYGGSSVATAFVDSVADGVCDVVLGNGGGAALDAAVTIHYLILGPQQ